MSPAPARTSRDAILRAARTVLETDGLEGLTMQSVAERVGVRAPSLYKHVADRGALIRAVTDSIAADLAATLRVARPSADPRTDLRSIARRYRAFVHANPVGYGLLFANLGPGLRPDEAAMATMGEPIVVTIARLVDPSTALPVARTFVSWAHGFTSMETAGAFRLGGDIDAAFAAGLELILDGISERATPSAG